MHIWKAETTAEKKEAQQQLDILNAAIEPEAKRQWELETAMRRMNLRQKPGGRVPQWKFTAATGKLVRDSKGGIDWWRYQKVILEPKLIPFAEKMSKKSSEYGSTRRQSTFSCFKTSAHCFFKGRG